MDVTTWEMIGIGLGLTAALTIIVFTMIRSPVIRSQGRTFAERSYSGQNEDDLKYDEDMRESVKISESAEDDYNDRRSVHSSAGFVHEDRTFRDKYTICCCKKPIGTSSSQSFRSFNNQDGEFELVLEKLCIRNVPRTLIALDEDMNDQPSCTTPCGEKRGKTIDSAFSEGPYRESRIQSKTSLYKSYFALIPTKLEEPATNLNSASTLEHITERQSLDKPITKSAIHSYLVAKERDVNDSVSAGATSADSRITYYDLIPTRKPEIENIEQNSICTEETYTHRAPLEEPTTYPATNLKSGSTLKQIAERQSSAKFMTKPVIHSYLVATEGDVNNSDSAGVTSADSRITYYDLIPTPKAEIENIEQNNVGIEQTYMQPEAVDYVCITTPINKDFKYSESSHISEKQSVNSYYDVIPRAITHDNSNQQQYINGNNANEIYSKPRSDTLSYVNVDAPTMEDFKYLQTAHDPGNKKDKQFTLKKYDMNTSDESNQQVFYINPSSMDTDKPIHSSERDKHEVDIAQRTQIPKNGQQFNGKIILAHEIQPSEVSYFDMVPPMKKYVYEVVLPESYPVLASTHTIGDHSVETVLSTLPVTSKFKTADEAERVETVISTLPVTSKVKTPEVAGRVHHPIGSTNATVGVHHVSSKFRIRSEPEAPSLYSIGSGHVQPVTEEDEQKVHQFLNQYSSIFTYNLKDPIPKDPETFPGRSQIPDAIKGKISRTALAESISHMASNENQPQLIYNYPPTAQKRVQNQGNNTSDTCESQRRKRPRTSTNHDFEATHEYGRNQPYTFNSSQHSTPTYSPAATEIGFLYRADSVNPEVLEPFESTNQHKTEALSSNTPSEPHYNSVNAGVLSNVTSNAMHVKESVLSREIGCVNFSGNSIVYSGQPESKHSTVYTPTMFSSELKYTNFAPHSNNSNKIPEMTHKVLPIPSGQSTEIGCANLSECSFYSGTTSETKQKAVLIPSCLSSELGCTNLGAFSFISSTIPESKLQTFTVLSGYSREIGCTNLDVRSSVSPYENDRNSDAFQKKVVITTQSENSEELNCQHLEPSHLSIYQTPQCTEKNQNDVPFSTARSFSGAPSTPITHRKLCSPSTSEKIEQIHNYDAEELTNNHCGLRKLSPVYVQPVHEISRRENEIEDINTQSSHNTNASQAREPNTDVEQCMYDSTENIFSPIADLGVSSSFIHTRELVQSTPSEDNRDKIIKVALASNLLQSEPPYCSSQESNRSLKETKDEINRKCNQKNSVSFNLPGDEDSSQGYSRNDNYEEGLSDLKVIDQPRSASLSDPNGATLRWKIIIKHRHENLDEDIHNIPSIPESVSTPTVSEESNSNDLPYKHDL